MRVSGGGDLCCAVPACCVRPLIYDLPRPVRTSWGSKHLAVSLPLTAMTWYSDYQDRRDRLLANGLLVLVRGARVDPDSGFMAIYLDANEGDLLRSHVDRDFALHSTLGYSSDYADGVGADAIERINRRWAGRLIRLRVEWVGSGGSAQLAGDDLIACDEDVSWLHRRGHYGNGLHVRPRQLHVSL